MRAKLGIGLVLVASLAGPVTARAGVYMTDDALNRPEGNNLRLLLSDLRGIPVPLPRGTTPEPGTLKAEFLQRSAELEARDQADNLSTLDRIDLGACYIRSRRFSDAVRVLRKGDQSHFLVLANQATAFFEMGELGQAVLYQEQALKNWPAVWAGWTLPQWIWYRRCEQLFLKLLRSRYDAQRMRGGRPGPVTDVDPLFRARFAGAAGRYEAGPLPLVWEDLPPDADRMVLQLVYWLPFDDALTWLYAEVLNARGQIELAYQLMEDLVGNRQMSNVEQLKQHRHILRRAIGDRQALSPELRLGLLWGLAPRGVLTPPGLPTVAAEAAWPVADLVDQLARANPFPPPGDNPAPTDDAGPVLSDRQPLVKPVLIGFGVGVLVTVLIALQWREWSRRRRAGMAGTRESERSSGETSHGVPVP